MHICFCVCVHEATDSDSVHVRQLGGGVQNNRQRQTDRESRTEITAEQSVQRKVTQSAVTMAIAQTQGAGGRQPGDGLVLVCGRVRVCALTLQLAAGSVGH